MAFRIGLEARHVDDGEFGIEGLIVRRGRYPQQMADKERVPSELANHAGGEAVRRVSAAVEVLNEQLAALGMGEKVAAQRVEMVL